MQNLLRLASTPDTSALSLDNVPSHRLSDLMLRLSSYYPRTAHDRNEVCLSVRPSPVLTAKAHDTLTCPRCGAEFRSVLYMRGSRRSFPRRFPQRIASDRNAGI